MVPGILGQMPGGPMETVAREPRTAAASTRAKALPSKEENASGVSSLLTGCVLAGAAAYLYANLFIFWRVPVLLGGDQTFFWEYASRMLRGQRPYVDFFEFTPPGTDLFYLALFKIFGPRIWVTNLAVLALGVALCWVCLRISAALMRRSLAVLATGVFLVVIYGKLLNGTHHWFSVFLGLVAVSVVMRNHDTPRMAIAGGLLGLASFFTQTHGAIALAAFAAWIVWGERKSPCWWRNSARRLAPLLLGFCVVLGAASAYWIAIAGIGRLWYFQVIYPHLHMLRGFGRSYWGLPAALTLRGLPALLPILFVYILLPVAYPTALILLWRNRSPQDATGARGAGLLALVGLFWLAEVAISPSWLRVYTVAMPAVILLFWMVGKSGRWRARLEALAWIAVVLLGARQTWIAHHLPRTAMQLPAGRAAVDHVHAEKFDWLMQYTQPGEYFFEPYGPAMCFPLELRNPAFTDEMSHPDYVLPAIQEADEKKVRYLLWPAALRRNDLGSIWTVHLTEMRNYVAERYKRVQVFSDGDEIWERK